MTNDGFALTASLLEKQAARLQLQAQLRAEAKAAATETARRAQMAQVEARQAASAAAAATGGVAAVAGLGGPGGDDLIAAAAAVRAMKAAAAATEASEAAAASAMSALSKGEQWMGADSLALLLGGLVDCRVDVQAHPVALQVVKRACRAVMVQVSVLSEEELKKENQEVCVFVRKREESGRERERRGWVLLSIR